MYEPECYGRCKSQIHAMKCFTAITKGTTEEIQVYLRWLCGSFLTLSDPLGRTVLHMASSCGKDEIVHWLLEQPGCDLNVQDAESGWTALHRSFYFGHFGVAKSLLEHGASLKVRDHDGFTPLEVLMKDHLPYIEYLPSNLLEAYVFGSNANYNLGIESDHSKDNPEVIEYFMQNNITIKQVIMCKFHSIFLSQGGLVYTCGYGLGGRLGHSKEQTCIRPSLVVNVNTNNRCQAIAAGNDHLVLLMESGLVLTCGLNTHHQLGHQPPPKQLLIPQPISLSFLKNQDIIGVAAAQYHSLVYTQNALYTFGLNAGQLGHRKGEKTEVVPRLVTAVYHENRKITDVVTSNGAIACVTDQGDIFILHQYQCRKIASRQLNLLKICITGGQLNTALLDGDVATHELRVCILTKGGSVYLWKESNPFLVRCLFSFPREIPIANVHLNYKSVAVVLKNGECFIGDVPANVKVPQSSKVASESKSYSEKRESGKQKLSEFGKTSLVTLLDVNECYYTKARRIPHIHRAVEITSDMKGSNFAILQSHPKFGLLDLPFKLESQYQNNMKEFLAESLLAGSLSDVIIEVQNKQYFLHKYILSSRSEYFCKLFASKTTEVQDNFVLDISQEAFEEMLLFMYSNTTNFLLNGKEIKWKKNEPAQINENSLIRNGVKTSKSKKQNNKNKDGCKMSPLDEVKDAAQKLGISILSKKLKGVKLLNGKIENPYLTPLPKLKFDRKKLSSLYDVWIKSSDDEEFGCHKCVLASQSKYFHGMLTVNWFETQSTAAISLPIPSKTLELVLNFLYTDELSGQKEATFLCNVLVIADQLLLDRLKSLCECALADLLTLKNAPELLDMASICNAPQLKATCLQYICINIPAFIESGTLDILDDDLMNEISKSYKNLLPKVGHRVITPYDSAPTHEELQQISKDISITDIATLPPATKPQDKKKSKKVTIHKNEITPLKVNSKSTPVDVISSPQYKQNEQLDVGSPPEISFSPEPLHKSSRSSHARDIPVQVRGNWASSPPPEKTVFSLSEIMNQEKLKMENSQKNKKSNHVPHKSWKKLDVHSSPNVTKAMEASSPPTSCPWSTSPPISSPTLDSFWNAKADSPSLDDVMKEEMEKHKASIPKRNRMKSENSISETVSLKNIQEAEEYAQKQLLKATSKPLHLINIEDQAIEDLLKFYHAEDNPNEIITVERIVPVKPATPIWRKHSSNSMSQV